MLIIGGGGSLAQPGCCAKSYHPEIVFHTLLSYIPGTLQYKLRTSIENSDGSIKSIMDLLRDINIGTKTED